MRAATALACIATLVPTLASAQIVHKNSGAERSPAISLRKRVHVNTLISAPDTIEIEFGGSFSTTGPFSFPTAIHYTPQGSHVWWGRTEFSVSFDSLSHDTVTHAGDRASFAATCVVKDGDKLDIAIAPQASVLLRGDTGLRLGGTAIARYDSGRSSTGVTFTWTGATAASATNPAGTFDVGAGYGYQIGHITPHVNWLWEKSTRVERQVSLFEGFEYQFTDNFALDFAVQHISLWGGAPDTQVAIGLTLNTAKLHHH